MTGEQVPSKAELLEAIRTSGEEAMARLRALPAEAFEQGRYENGWNGRQILAHIASIEWSYPRLLEIPKEAPPALPQGGAGEGGLPTRAAQGGIDAYNQRQVQQRAEASVADLLAEFERNRAALIAAVAGTDDALFAVPIRSAGGLTGPLGTVLYNVAVGHVLGHMRDITGGTA